MNKNAENPEIRPFPWKCGWCRQREIYPVTEEYTTEVVHDDRTYDVKIPALRLYRCKNCGEAMLDSDASHQITQAFLKRAGLLMPEEIRQKREQLGLTPEELATRLEVPFTTLNRWEMGAQLQPSIWDKLLRLFFDHPESRHFLSPAQTQFTTENMRQLDP